MAFDFSRLGPRDLDRFTPMQIAHHPHLSRGEKLELLTDLRAVATGIVDSEDYGFACEDIDEAISDVEGAPFIRPNHKAAG
ncbi:hypothetical protein GCM10011321_25770 [Youhaiella tibetensis]|uniref:Uncharacterized protein n=1 Tax=Paradevosia tibetensis TaxID=1447062 RepID=A0A5B9DL75_9HYPH|nr:hypothetical protein [Youhaiella tibetensis]QEE19409.1 hypothetical protein FNA67_04125 [Youhaiella tibetensis]GGF33436.1 hypothetical protein GCM10011321_25770 [Youhaiella tibetensis]